MTLEAIVVETAAYEYMGLYKGTKIWADVVIGECGIDQVAQFPFQGRNWTLYDQQFSVVVGFRAEQETKPITNTGPIKSDGGSSSYYDLSFPEWLLYTLNERQKEDKCYIKTEELIRVLFKNDFSFGTLFKSLVRAFQITQGSGKAGNDMDYECGKIHYYADKIKEQQEKK